MKIENLPFENRELTGITFKNAFWIIGGLVSILAAIITTYASIMNKLEKNQYAIDEMTRNKEITAMQIKTLEVQLQTVEIRLVRLETQLNKRENQ